MVQLQVVASVIVPCYQAADTLEGCLSSIISQKVAFEFEVLLVENGSTDGSLAVAESFLGPGSPLRILQESEPGSYAARNRGVEEAQGAYLVFTDSDCQPRQGWLASLVSALQDPWVVLAGGEVEGAQEQRGILARYGRSTQLLSQAHTLRHPMGGFLQTANLAVRRADAESVGGFEAGLFSGGDADFCWRLRGYRPGGLLRLVPDAEVDHLHRESLRGFYRQFYRYGQGDVMVSRLHGSKLSYTGAKILLDLLRVFFLPVLLAVGAVGALVKRDVLRVYAPLLTALRILARRSGQISVLVRCGSMRRT